MCTTRANQSFAEAVGKRLRFKRNKEILRSATVDQLVEALAVSISCHAFARHLLSSWICGTSEYVRVEQEWTVFQFGRRCRKAGAQRTTLITKVKRLGVYRRRRQREMSKPGEELSESTTMATSWSDSA